MLSPMSSPLRSPMCSPTCMCSPVCMCSGDCIPMNNKLNSNPPVRGVGPGRQKTSPGLSQLLGRPVGSKRGGRADCGHCDCDYISTWILIKLRDRTDGLTDLSPSVWDQCIIWYNGLLELLKPCKCPSCFFYRFFGMQYSLIYWYHSVFFANCNFQFYHKENYGK